MISYIGPDGSGKSTAINYSVEFLERNKISHKTLYPFNYFILRKLINFFQNNINLSSTVQKKKNLVTKNKNVVIKIFWPIFALIDSWLWYFYVTKINSKDILLCDRYFHDLSTAFDEFNLAFSFLNKFYIKLIPKPDIVILLSGEPLELQKRELGDCHEIDFFERQVKRYQDLSLKDPSIVVLKTNFFKEDIERIFKDIYGT